MAENETIDRVQKIRELFDNRINPVLANHGGFAELVEVKDNKVFIRVGGGCMGCGMASVTIKQGIQGLIQRLFPDIEDVLDVTDHTQGMNPFYEPEK